MRIIVDKFWEWYEKHLLINQVITVVLFLWQILHLYWLSTHVVASKLFGHSLFNPSESYQFLLIIADYFEIPALISGTLFYIYNHKKGYSIKNILFIILINSQWLHLFWITDEFVLERFKEGAGVLLPVWLAWLAIFIDYLELPVIYDTSKVMMARILNLEKKFEKQVEQQLR